MDSEDADETAGGPRRRRPIMKGVYFTSEEWERAQAIMERGGFKSVSDFVREMVLSGKVTVNERTLDVAAVRAALAPMGNNVSQIARKVSVDDYASLEQLEGVRYLMGRVDATLTRYLRGGEGDGGEDRADS